MNLSLTNKQNSPSFGARFAVEDTLPKINALKALYANAKSGDKISTKVEFFEIPHQDIYEAGCGVEPSTGGKRLLIVATDEDAEGLENDAAELAQGKGGFLKKTSKAYFEKVRDLYDNATEKLNVVQAFRQLTKDN